jgi:hypothetical protein
MFETIKTSPFPKALQQIFRNRATDGIVIATIFFMLVPTVWADSDNNSNNNSEIVAALSTSKTVPPEAQDLASSFVDHTLPRLLADDVRVAAQLGFGGTLGDTVVLGQALPLMIIYHKDVLKFAGGNSGPIDLVNNTNNWIKDQAGKLSPRRMVFSLKVNDGASESGTHSWSSVTVEHSPSGSWRVFQVGAPKLAQAMNRYQAPGATYFLLWIPDLNRHYLGQIGPDAAHPKVTLTVLFNDPLAQRSPGEQIDVASPNFIRKLIDLYQRLSQNLPLLMPVGP